MTIESQRTEYWRTLYSTTSMQVLYLIFCSENDDLAPHVGLKDGVRLTRLAMELSNLVKSNSRARWGNKFGTSRKVFAKVIRQSFKEAMNQNDDTLISPATPSAAYKIGEKKNYPLVMYAGDIMTLVMELVMKLVISKRTW
ncbi:hypothetical protein TSUD_149410 [Trifolium subterraneum]|uniref:Uncharacterized protein n=1 Tax=Trifolium subterraneum TaxID=3900 RepID=A0A2Z6N5N3_TRISU|nr:hypothetical protein TSUD_149410 [Trifolium subterraneum]